MVSPQFVAKHSLKEACSQNSQMMSKQECASTTNVKAHWHECTNASAPAKNRSPIRPLWFPEQPKCCYHFSAATDVPDQGLEASTMPMSLIISVWSVSSPKCSSNGAATQSTSSLERLQCKMHSPPKRTAPRLKQVPITVCPANTNEMSQNWEPHEKSPGLSSSDHWVNPFFNSNKLIQVQAAKLHHRLIHKELLGQRELTRSKNRSNMQQPVAFCLNHLDPFGFVWK